MPIDYSAKGGVMAGDMPMRVGYEAVAQGTPSALGDAAQIWSQLASLWAEVVVLEGQELLKAKQVHAEAKVRITIRFNPAVDSSGRFNYGGNYYYPASVVPDPLKRKMVCICYERPGEN